MQPDSKTNSRSKCEEVPSGTHTHRNICNKSRGKGSPDKKLKTLHTNVKGRQLTLGNTARGRRQSWPRVQGPQLGLRRWQWQERQKQDCQHPPCTAHLYTGLGEIRMENQTLVVDFSTSGSFKPLSSFLCNF